MSQYVLTSEVAFIDLILWVKKLLKQLNQKLSN